MAGQKIKKIVEKPSTASREKPSTASRIKNKTKSAQLEMEVCKYCKEISLSEVQTVTCERCEDLICISCSKLSSKEYSFLQKSKLLHWFCRDCEKPTLGARKREELVEEHGNESKLLNDVVNSLSEMVRSLSDKLSLLCNELTEVKAQLKNTEEKEVKNKTADLSEVANDSSRELLDRERRKANLVWFGIPESNASDAKDRVMDDSAFVVDCCSKVLNTSIDVISCKRLRSKDTAGNTVRPLLVTVKDSAQVWSVLKTARKLGESADYKSVFVKKDSTPLERAVFRKKWQERIRRKGKENQVNHFQAAKTTPAAQGQSEEMEDK